MTATVIRGDARALPLPDASVDLIVTSPPYWALRSYTDGCPDCASTARNQTRGYMERYCPQCDRVFESGRNKCHKCNVTTLMTDKAKAAQAVGRPDCATCGGTGRGHYDGQIGAEATPQAYIDSLIACTAEWIRVLKPTGSLWVNLGDSYATRYSSVRGAGRAGLNGDDDSRGLSGQNRTAIPEKSLRGLPWRYALRCIDQLGLILRAEIIWSKPNGLPESVTDRVRRSHEVWFHLVKSPRYFAAVDTIREQYAPGTAAKYRAGYSPTSTSAGAHRPSVNVDYSGTFDCNPLGKMPGSVWQIPTQPLTVPAHLGVDHFAAFPMAWPRRIVQGWSPSGVCTACGEGRRPVASSVGLDMTRPQARRAHQLATDAGLTEAHFGALLSVGVSDTGRGAATQNGTGKNTPQVYALADQARAVLGGYAREYLLRRPTGFREVCACPDTTAPTQPSVILDPFGGTGTVALVADVLGRHGITVDMSADYCRLAAWRTTEPGQRAAALEVDKPAPVHPGQATLLDLLEPAPHPGVLA